MAKIRVFPNRESLYTSLPKDAIGAELGVQRGDNAKILFKVAEPRELHLIDMWERRHPYNLVRELFAPHEQVIIHQAATQDLVVDFDDEYFDWIYVDADHAYNSVNRDLRLYHSKVKENGLVLGHDFFNHGRNHMDVIKAVLECVADGLFEFLYLTKERYPSYGLRRL